MQLLGIDLGTSSVKALLVNDTGQVLAQGSAEYPIRYPQPGYAEQSPEDWWAATLAAVRQILDNIQGTTLSIAAIGLSGQMHGTVLLDSANRLLGPAIIWPDQRSQRQVREIRDLIGAKRLIEITGSPVATGFQAATIRWLQQQRPELWQKVHMVLAPKDYLRWRMTGELLTEASDGSGTLLLDVLRRDWSAEILQALDIDQDQLPEVAPSDAIAGYLHREAAGALGLQMGIPVITGAADTACGTLGAGVVDDKTLLLTISTGGQLILPAANVNLDLEGRIHTFCGSLAPEPGRAPWYQMAAILSAGMSLRWLRDHIFNLTSEDAYDLMVDWAGTTPAGANGLLFMPYLVGERTPHMDPQARGMFLGFTASHGRAEMVRAVMEGVALGCYDAFSVLTEIGARPERIVMAGGGARSSLWRQIVADVFSLPVLPLETAEQAALGAVLLAGSGIGLFDAGMTAQDWAGYGTAIEPVSSRHSTYRELFDMFRAAYSKHQADFKRLDSLST
jgi:xylulokinase